MPRSLPCHRCLLPARSLAACALFADVAVASPLLRYTLAHKYMGTTAFIATTIPNLIVWRTAKRVERITKSYNIFHVAFGALLPLGISTICAGCVCVSACFFKYVVTTVRRWCSALWLSNLQHNLFFPIGYICVCVSLAPALGMCLCTFYIRLVYNAWEHYRVPKSKSWYLVAGGKLVKVSESSISC